jgi:hypothetical protein
MRNRNRFLADTSGSHDPFHSETEPGSSSRVELTEEQQKKLKAFLESL